MNAQGAVDGVISQDYDCLLFGARRVFRNMTFSGRRKVPGRNFYVNVRPEYIDLEENLSNLSINRRQLIWIGMLTGTDFNRGVHRVGAKTGLNLVRKGNTLQQILEMKSATIESLDEVEDIFLNPPHEEWGDIQLRPPDRESIIKILCDRHNFSPERVSPYVDTLSKLYSKGAQKSLDRFF
jgi:flap endonuclease 1 (EC 3.1.-.-)